MSTCQPSEQSGAAQAAAAEPEIHGHVGIPSRPLEGPVY
ncbi:hypothetical protein PspLS_01455 [Pyricularia sp. CBS 133598]|nr:hypothetical protein PspLS_01455 [Pyricularia sp. CBS 133598]